MNEKPENSLSQLSEAEAQDLLRSLLHKEGTWVDWGKHCQILQKAGYSAQTIFEQTGFQASQQNLVIVAAQVYDSLIQAGSSAEVLDYFSGPRSDVLHEFRILSQTQRQSAAELAYNKRVDVDGAHEIARAIKDFSRLPQVPEPFSNHPGDAVAYQCWQRARQKKDLQDRTRLIAQGLKFAHSQGAREAIEKLLTDFTVIPSKTAPLLPIYRLEEEEELPRIVPVAGSFPLTSSELEGVVSVVSEEPFRIISCTEKTQLVPLPGWQVVLKAVDPVAIFAESKQLPPSSLIPTEEVLVVIDRQQKEWNVNSYFAIERDGQIDIHWFEDSPNLPLLGQVILVLRPKRILDENNLLEPWQMDD